MRFLLVALLLVSIALAGCANVKTYTFKKDRVDQRVEGNRGYIMGTPPPAPVVREVPKRTLIGVDIEIPVLPGEEAKVPPEEGVGHKGETVVEKETPAPVPVVTEEPAKKESQEEWIK